jgi:hypothetical protein
VLEIMTVNRNLLIGVIRNGHIIIGELWPLGL